MIVESDELKPESSGTDLISENRFDVEPKSISRQNDPGLIAKESHFINTRNHARNKSIAKAKALLNKKVKIQKHKKGRRKSSNQLKMNGETKGKNCIITI